MTDMTDSVYEVEFAVSRINRTRKIDKRQSKSRQSKSVRRDEERANRKSNLRNR